VGAITQTQWGRGEADFGDRPEVVKGRCIYPNLKLRIYTTGMRQNRLARLVGIDEAYLSRILNGVRVPGQQIRLQIANVLGCESEWLFERATLEATGSTVRE
jgi:transcriptional regulator with XRE-family HTH domain